MIHDLTSVSGWASDDDRGPVCLGVVRSAVGLDALTYHPPDSHDPPWVVTHRCERLPLAKESCLGRGGGLTHFASTPDADGYDIAYVLSHDWWDDGAWEAPRTMPASPFDLDRREHR